MKIGITLNPYGEKKPAGLGRAILEVVRAILEIDRKNEYTIFLKNPNLNLDLPGNNWKVSKISPYIVHQLDVCIFNTPVMLWWYGIFGRAKKSVVIAYDFAYLRKFETGDNPLPNLSPFKGERRCGASSFRSKAKVERGEGWGSSLRIFFLKLVHSSALKRSNLIISISEATKKDLINIFKVPSEKIKVVYLGYNNICHLAVRPALPAGRPPSVASEKFFLFVGAIKERKNVHGVIEAFNLFKNSSNFSHKLVIAGNGSGEYFEKVKKIAVKDVIFLGQVSDSELSYLYQKAEALLYPSFIEGFGFPVLEAQMCGLPVITSNTFSLPEVAGNGAIIVDPSNPLEISEAMKKICQDQNFHHGLIERGRENAKKFSWQKTAQEILKIL